MIQYIKRTESLTPFIFLHPNYKSKKYAKIDLDKYQIVYETLDAQFNLNELLSFPEKFFRKRYERHDSTLEGYGIGAAFDIYIPKIITCYPTGLSLQPGLKGYKQLTFILDSMYFSATSELERFKKVLKNYGLSDNQIVFQDKEFIRKNFMLTDILTPDMSDYDSNLQLSISKEFLQVKNVEYTKWIEARGKEYKRNDWVIVTDAILQSRWAHRYSEHPSLLGYMFTIHGDDGLIDSFNGGNEHQGVAPDNRYRVNYNKSFVRHATEEEIQKWLELHPEDAITTEEEPVNSNEDDLEEEVTEPEFEEEAESISERIDAILQREGSVEDEQLSDPLLGTNQYHMP